MSCEFLSWTNLTTNTATSYSLLFALSPCYSTWFLEFITYSATLSPLFLAFYAWYSTWGLHNFLGEKNLFPRFMHALLFLQKIQNNTKLVSIRLGALSSLLRTLLDLGLPHAAPMQGESLGTNQADIMAWPASLTMWTKHRCRLFIPVLTWQAQKPSPDKELQLVHYRRQIVT